MTTLMPLPRLEELPVAVKGGLDPAAVGDALRRLQLHVWSLGAPLRELQGARAAAPEIPVVAEGGAARREAVTLVRAASAFAERIEADAVREANRRLRDADDEVRRRGADIAAREVAVAALERELEARRSALVEETRRAAEAEASRLVEDATREAADIVSEARAEAERRLEWARGQAELILRRARAAAEQGHHIRRAG